MSIADTCQILGNMWLFTYTLCVWVPPGFSDTFFEEQQRASWRIEKSSGKSDSKNKVKEARRVTAATLNGCVKFFLTTLLHLHPSLVKIYFNLNLRFWGTDSDVFGII